MKQHPNVQTRTCTAVRWGNLREVGISLHCIMVALTRGRHVRFQMQPLVTILRFFSTSCSNYVPMSAASCLNCISRTQMCTAFVMMFHVFLLSHTDIYSPFLPFIKKHMEGRLLQFLVSNCNTLLITEHMFLRPRFLLRLL